MKAAFHYVVRAKLIRLKKGNEIDFLEFEDKFENENPILAREDAFRHYQNYIDVLLQGKGKTYISDRQAREELNSFIDTGTGTTTRIKVGETEIDFSDSFGNGIGIFMIIDDPKEDVVFDDKIGQEVFIHGIGNFSLFGYNSDSIIFDLEREFAYYKHYNYDTKNKEIQVVYCHREECEEGYLGNGEWLEGYNEPNTHEILETPFDWTGYNKLFWWGEPANNIEGKKTQIPETGEDLDKYGETINVESKPALSPEKLEDLIKGGETNQVEFKPTLLYNFSTGKAGIGIKAIIAKTICAFLNSNGGFLFIGLTDEGKTQGLDFDFKLADGKKPTDFFRLEFDQMLVHFLSFSVKTNVEADFYERDGKDVFVVTVRPNKRRPIFLKGQSGLEFYVRGEASSRRLTDIEELVNYCLDRWTNQ